jgi:hypothetical protein
MSCNLSNYNDELKTDLKRGRLSITIHPSLLEWV